jgi:hypothetical protein
MGQNKEASTRSEYKKNSEVKIQNRVNEVLDSRNAALKNEIFGTPNNK